MNVQNLTYAGSGVNYDALDPFKLACQLAARETAQKVLIREDFEEIGWSRGESVYLLRMPDGSVMGHVEEGLGTKNLVADAMYALTGKSYYDQIAQDTVAMIVNDMITLGVKPKTIAMHLAVGSSDWFKDEKRFTDLIRGWTEACITSDAVWSGGETPALKDIIMPATALLSGSAVGFINDEADLMNPEDIEDGDAIVIIESSGIHANGLTLARKIANKLPDGYLTKIYDGRTYGETLLDPTPIYVPLINECMDAGLMVKYGVNITGHGWRKLMRANQPFEYLIEKMPAPQHIFEFIRREGPVDEVEMYSNYNMGAGFALYVKMEHVGDVVSLAGVNGFKAFKAGVILKSDEKRVVIEPKRIVFESDTLAVR